MPRKRVADARGGISNSFRAMFLAPERLIMIKRGRNSRSALLRRRQILRKLLPVETLETRRVLSAMPFVEPSSMDLDSAAIESPAHVHEHGDHDGHGHHDHPGHDHNCHCHLCTGNHGLPLPTAAEIQSALEEDPEPPLASADLSQTFLLHSYPSATKTIYLDFNGETTSGTIWNSSFNSNEDIVTPAYSYTGDSSFTDAEKTRIYNIWRRVSEDFAPFDVNVTTEEPDVADLKKSGSGDTKWGIRVVIGGNGSWYGSAGGTGYVGSFRWGSDTPVFVFSQNLGSGHEKYTAEAISHETGHALGLYHDGRTSPSEEYYAGSGSGATGWAPIMGNSYSRQLTQWSKGEYANASNTSQDDLSVITSSSNGFGYRDDDHGSDTGSATSLTLDSGSVSAEGIIEKTDDVDVFSFTTDGGAIDLNVDPFERGPNLDIQAALYTAAGSLVLSSNPATSLAASLATTLAAGQYFLKIEGVGNGDAATGGYSDYASLGQYTISGTLSGGVVAEKTEDDTFSVDEDSETATLDVLANDTAGSSPLTITSLGTTSQGGTVSIQSGTSIAYTPAADFHGTETFTYTVNNGGAGADSTATVTVTVNSINDAPVAVDDAYTVNEDSDTKGWDVLLNDSTESGETLVVTNVGDGSQGGTVTNAGNGFINYKPFANFFGTETFTYTVNDGNAGSNDTATVTITVNPVNDDPIANDDMFTVAEDSGNTTLNVLTNDETEIGETLTITDVGAGSAGGSLLIQSGTTIRYRPADDFFGTETFTYTVNDGNVGSNDTATVTVTVTSVNDRPEVANDSFTVAEDSGNTTFDVLANDTTEAGETLTITSVGTASAGGSLTIVDGETIRYNPAENFFGTETFTYTVNDGNVGSNDTATVTVSITSVNDKPVAANDSFTVAEDSGNTTLDVLANDTTEAGETLTIASVGSGSNGGSIQIVNGTSLRYRPAVDFFGTETFTYTVNDGTASSNDTATVTVTVTPVNEAPTAADDNFTVAEDSGQTSLDVMANDATESDETLTIVAVGNGSAGGTIEIQAGTSLRYEPAEDFFGTETFTYTVNDGKVGSNDTATVTVNVNAVNDAPVANDDSYTVTQNSSNRSFNVLANDTTEAGESLTILSTSVGSQGGWLQISNGTAILYRPAVDFFGTETFTYTIGDGVANSRDTATVTVSVTEDEGGPTLDRIRIRQPRREYLQLAEVEVIEKGTGNNVALSGAATQSTTYDANSGAEQAIDGDRISGYPISLAHTQLETGAWWQVDLGGDVEVESITVFNREIAGQRLEGAIVEGYSGDQLLWTDTITGAADRSQHSFSPEIIIENNAPVANDDAYQLGQNSAPTSFGVLANDTTEAGESLSITSVSSGSHGGSISIENGSSIRYQPAEGFFGTETFTYTINDGTEGNDDTATVTVNVIPAPDGTTINRVRIHLPNLNYLQLAEVEVIQSGTQENLAISGTATQSTTYDAHSGAEQAIDGDRISGYPTSLAHTNLENGAWWEVDLGGEFSVETISVFNRNIAGQRLEGAVVEAYTGVDTLVWSEVITGTGDGSRHDFNPTGGTDNPPPVANDDSFNVDENSSNTPFDVLSNDTTDLDETLSITSVGAGSAGGWIAIVDSSSILYRPAADFTGTETFTYTINDGQPGNNATATVTVSVDAVNEAPVANADSYQLSQDSGPTNFGVLANDTTESGETLTITSISPGSDGGSISIVNGSSISYQPANGFVGTETFTYTVNDGTPGSNDTATVTVNVLAVANGTTINRVRITLPGLNYLQLAEVEVIEAGSGVNLAPSGVATQSTTYDANTGAEQAVDGDRVSGYPTSLSHTELENNAWWEIDLGGEFSIDTISVFNRDIAGQRIEGAIVTAFTGVDTVVWSDSIQGAQDGSRHDFQPTAGNDNLPPSAHDDSFTVEENSGNTPLDVLANDTTDAGEILSITSVGPGSQGGWIAIVNSSSILYRPAANFVGTETFSYTVNDGQPGNDDTATVTVTVTPEPEPQLVKRIRILHPQRQYLTLAEVEVIAADGQTNLALNGTATQSTTYDQNSGAEQAIDGDRISGYPTSLAHTQLETGAWWEVDLQQASALSSVRVYNRDIAGQRLQGAIVQAFNAEGTIIWSAPITNTTDGSVHEYDLTSLTGATAAAPTLLAFSQGEGESNQEKTQVVDPLPAKTVQVASEPAKAKTPWRNRIAGGKARELFFSALGSSQDRQLDEAISELF